MLTVYRSHRAENLLDALAEVLAVPVGPPTVAEWIAVQSRGMETWLSMELSRRFGVWSAAVFPFPRAAMERLFEPVIGPRPAEGLAFTSEDLTWAVMALLPDLVEREGFEALHAYLQGDPRGRKLFGLAHRVAIVLDQYPVYRPDMVLGWEAGRSSDWQAVLHRAIVERHGGHHMATRAGEFLAALDAGAADLSTLPRRISLFGVSALPPLYVDVLAALSHRVDVHLFLPCASTAAWDRLGTQAPAPDPHPPVTAAGHPLRSTLGRLTDDFQRVLQARTAFRDRPRFSEPDDAPASLLHRLQSDILHDRDPSETERFPMAPDDRSLAIHTCHSAQREVEVLHDQLLHLLQSDATLQPDDVIVMAPNVESYAPHVEAAFASASGGAIPFRIADRRSRDLAPAAEAFLGVLDMVRDRATATAVLDLLSTDAVRRRFGFEVDDLGLVRRWVVESGIRWGIDADHRRDWGLPADATNTWRFGLDRLLLGLALPGERLFGGALPYDEIEGQTSAILGRLVEFCDVLFTLVRGLASPRPVDTWVTDLTGALERLTTDEGDGVLQQQVVRDALSDLGSHAAHAGLSADVDLEVVHAWLASHLDETRSAHGFLSGGVTVCNLLPMRSVPFRVVCLLGMNDGEFPRPDPPPGFDRMASEPRTGDRSPRSDDRHQFLEAVLAARQHLLITYIGQGISDNAALPPSVLVSDLLDTLAATCAGEPDVVVRHRLQPFNPRYFQGDERLVSYRAGYYEGARALLGEKTDPPPFLEGPLPTEPLDALSLDDLARFLRSPADWLVTHRLGIREAIPGAALDEREPIRLDHLQTYLAAQSMLEHAVEQGTPYSEVLHARGILPHGAPGRCVANDLADRIEPLAAAIRAHTSSPSLPPLDVAIRVGGAHVTGRLDGLWPGAQLHYTASRTNAARLLALWVRHLALACVAPEGYPKTSTLIARGPGDGGEATVLDPLDDRAAGWLADLVELFGVGCAEPLRFFPRTSYTYARHRIEGLSDAEAMGKARGPWSTSWTQPGEAEGFAVQRLFGGVDPLVDVAGPLGFREVALHVFEPLLGAMRQDAP